MSKASRRLWFSRRLSFVPRWAVVPHIRRQSVAEHCYGVACLADYLVGFHEAHSDMLFHQRVLLEALYHDNEEAQTGDHPSPTKDKHRPSPSTLEQTTIVVKVADKIEAALYCQEEIDMGNRVMSRMYNDVVERGGKYWDHFRWGYSYDKPEFRHFVMNVAQFSSINRHPVIDA